MSIIAISIISVATIDLSIKIDKFFLSKLLKELMTTILDFFLLIFNFHLKVFANDLFFFEILSIVFKKSFRFSTETHFKMRFGIISYYYLTSNIALVSSISSKNIGDKKALQYIQNLRENMIELYIISSKTSCFFI